MNPARPTLKTEAAAGNPLAAELLDAATPTAAVPEAAPPTEPGRAVMQGTQRFVITGAAIALGIAALHYGRPLLMPLAFAALLAFVLDPIVTALRRWHFPHALAVGVVMALTMASLGGGAVLLGQQVVALSQDLPAYQTTIRKKLRDLRPDPGGTRILKDAKQVLGMVEGELNKVREDAAGGAPARTSAPTRVQVEPAPPPPLRAIANILTPVVLPLATAGLVALLAVFLLLQRNEMRDRVVRLMGGDLHHMADVMNEAAHRVSRFLGAQLLVNMGYGVPMALGLWVIGVPGAVLWGFLSGVLRFIPYLGPAVAALFPLLLAFAVDPGWGMMAWTLALVLVMELIINNIVEPVAYGGSTGVSPVAVVLSAAFWALVWGPVGLVLATPLTVCLLVLGRHMAPLQFLELMLSSEPVFDKPTQLYQRLISGDQEEAIELSHQEVQSDSLLRFYSDTAVPMLALAARPSARLATAAQRHRVVSGVSHVLDDLRALHPGPSAAGAADAPAVAPLLSTVLCIGARNEMDSLSAEMLAHTLTAAGCKARAVPALAVTAERIDSLDLNGVDTVCVCAFSDAPQTHARFVGRRLRRRVPGLRVVLAAWAAPAELLLAGAATALGFDAVAASLAEAQARLLPAEVAVQNTLTQVNAQGNEQVNQQGSEQVSEQGNDQGMAPVPPQGQGTPGVLALDAVASGAVANLIDGSVAEMCDTLARGAQQAAEVFNVPLAVVTFQTPTMGPLYCSAGLPQWTSRRRVVPDAGGASTSVVTDPVLAQVLATGEAVVVPDLARDPVFADCLDPDLEGLSFCAAAPLRNADRVVVGMLALRDKETRPFTAVDRKLLVEMADALSASVAAQEEARAETSAQAAGQTSSAAAAHEPAGASAAGSAAASAAAPA